MNALKIKIAKEFIANHKLNDVNDWNPLTQSDEDKKYIAIFDNIINDVYGECRGLNFKCDFNGEVEQEATEFEIEISKFDSASGNPVIFGFAYICADEFTRQIIEKLEETELGFLDEIHDKEAHLNNVFICALFTSDIDDISDNFYKYVGLENALKIKTKIKELANAN